MPAASIAAGSIDNTKLAAGIDAAKLTTGTLPAARIGAGSITSTEILDGTVLNADIAAGSIDNTKLAAGIDAAKLTTGTLPAARIGAGSITSTEILDGTVLNADIAAAAIDNTKLAAGIDAAKITTGTLPAARIGAGSITSTEILDGTVLNADIAATAAIVDTKLATISTAGKVSGSAISGAMSGTLSGASITGTVAVANGGTGATTDAAARTNLGLGSISTLSAIGSTEITDLSIVNADISATAAIADTKLATISTAGKVSTSAISGVAGSLSGTLVGTGISATNVTTGTLPASVLPSSVHTGTGAAGQVAIWGGASALSSTANLTWDNTNFRLGIGTGVPAYTLDVNSAFATTVNIESSAADDVWTYYATSGAFVGAMGFRSNGNLVLFNSTDNLVISPTGNVGIGPTTPTAKLDVAGTFKLADATQGADKVLTSDASGNASWQNGSRNTAFHVNSNVPVSGPNNGNALIPFAVEEFDDGNDFAGNAFTAPTAGVYHFEATVTWNAFLNNTSYQFVRLFKNGSIFKDKMGPTHTNISANHISTTVKLAAGDVITVQVFQNSGAPVNTYTSGSQFTYFSGYRVY